MTRKEAFDIRTMEWFIPTNAAPVPITDDERQAMASLSSRGLLPAVQTEGFKNLMAGKTFRDYHIQTWRKDIADQLTTIDEVLADAPDWIKEYLSKKLTA